MFVDQWEVLLVDDEPDVLTLSKLMMRGFEVYGLPLKLHTSRSKSEAVSYLNGRPDRFAPVPKLALAFIDVVMETDHAGLDLCQYIREDMGNQLTQLFIRTGQPGMAPERTVIDRYDINGYFTKAEATEDKLYSLVKSGVRQHMSSRLTFTFQQLSHHMIVASQSRNDLAASVQRGMGRVRVGVGSTGVRLDIPTCVCIGERVIYSRDVDEKNGTDVVERLNQLNGKSLSSSGDKYVKDEDNYQLIKIAPQSDKAEISFLYQTPFIPPSYIVSMIHQYLTDLAILWQRAS